MTDDEVVPPFDPKGCRYDQSSYAGRLRRFREMTDPRMLLVGDEELGQAVALLQKHAKAFNLKAQFKPPPGGLRSFIQSFPGVVVRAGTANSRQPYGVTALASYVRL